MASEQTYIMIKPYVLDVCWCCDCILQPDQVFCVCASQGGGGRHESSWPSVAPLP